MTLPRGAGIALAAHRFAELSFERVQQSRYLLALAQYAPPDPGVVTFNAGLGHGRYWDGSTGSGLVGGAGVALRIPAGSVFALSVTSMYVAALTGTRDPDAQGQRAPLRPRLVLLTLGVSLASATP